jgi:putative flippase GtrA
MVSIAAPTSRASSSRLPQKHERMSRYSYREYLSYFLVGAVLAVVVIVLRHLIGLSLPDSPFFYGVSIVTVYVFGILASYCLQRRFTFRSHTHTTQQFPLLRFFVVAGMVSVFSTIAAFVFRYVLMFDALFGDFGASAAFLCAMLCASIINYIANATYVFARRDPAGQSNE